LRRDYTSRFESAVITSFLILILIQLCFTFALGEECSPSCWLDKGDKYLTNESYDLAARCYDKAIQLDPEDAIPWNNKGFALAAQGKYNEAIQACDEAIRLDPELAQAWALKSLALKALNRASEAEAAYARAEELGLSL